MTMKSIPGYESYLAGSDGVIYSVKTGESKPLTPYLKKPRRPAVSLWVDGSESIRYVHSLICEAFHGPRLRGMVVRHMDGDSMNNTPANLAWGTPRQNADDDRANGTHARRVENSRRRLSCNQRDFISTSGDSIAATARLFGITENTVRAAKRGGWPSRVKPRSAVAAATAPRD